MSATTVAAKASHKASTFKVLAAAAIGNALEFYDILIYGYFAVTISKLFFPTADPTTALLLTFGTFGISYLARPVGALVLGAYADRAGRRAAMLLSIVIMTIGTGLMAIMPIYNTSGFSRQSPCLLRVCCKASRSPANLAAQRHFSSSTPKTARAFSRLSVVRSRHCGRAVVILRRRSVHLAHDGPD